MFYVMTERVGRLKHFPGGENAAVSTATGAAAAPADSSLAVASHWICMATDCRTAGGHRQIARIRTWRIVLEGIYRAARRRVGAGALSEREGRNCFHHARTIAEIRRFDNGQAAAPDRRGARLSGYSGPRIAAPARPEIPNPAKPEPGTSPGNPNLETRTEAAGRHQTIRNNKNGKCEKKQFGRRRFSCFRVRILILFRYSSFGF
jgi:hypothetical protein